MKKKHFDDFFFGKTLQFSPIFYDKMERQSFDSKKEVF